MTLKFLIIIAAVISGGLAVAWWQNTPKDTTQETATTEQTGTAKPTVSPMHSGADTAAAKPVDEVVIPELSQIALQGKVNYEQSCAACHGVNVAGTDKGPPLIHSLYRPGHHPDEAFVSAVVNGVTAHHWKYGNMPPVPGGVSEAKMRWIIKYIREMQVANGVN
jgi:mono/diheme cytochrome c family protein